MQNIVNRALIVRCIAVVAAMVSGIFLLVHLIVPQADLLTKAMRSLQRIVDIALATSTDLLGLAIICGAAGLFMLMDRRRRSKVRQASA